MSIAVMAYVWEHSAQQGTDLTLILAIADFANQDGIAWPSIETLAKRIRADTRTTQRAMKRLETAGEVRTQKAAGPKGTNLYQIVMQKNLPLFAEQQDSADGVATSPPGKLPGVASMDKRGGTATPPEPSGTVIEKSVAGQGKPSPVAALFKTYQAGIQRLYGATYPPGPKANGQLAQVVKNLGAEAAAAALAYYLASKKPYYQTRKHALDVFTRDAADLYILLQQAGAQAVLGPAPSQAVAYIEYVDQDRVRMAEYPVGDALEIAKTFATEYASRVNRDTVTNVMIRIGNQERRFKREQLR